MESNKNVQVFYQPGVKRPFLRYLEMHISNLIFYKFSPAALEKCHTQLSFCTTKFWIPYLLDTGFPEASKSQS